MYKSATDIVKQNYIDYSIYSMKAKSYPSIYDGLTEVRRRCLVGAYTDAPATHMVKLSTMAAYALCYHPHSSDGIAEVIVNMTSPYTCPFPFFDGRGNFGDLNNPASAPRYLECMLNKTARKLYFSLYDEAPKENYEVREEPLYLPTLFPAALLQSQFLIGNGTPNCLIPSLDFGDLKNYIINYISKGETKVTKDNFVKLTDYEQIKSENRDKSICDLLNNGKGIITYVPNIEYKNGVITITNLYVLAKFDTLYSMLEDDIKADKLDVRDESDENFTWVIEKVKNKVYDMDALVKKIKNKFTYKENYALYFHDEKGHVKPYSLGEIITACYLKYSEAYSAKLNKEIDDWCSQRMILECLAQMSEHTDIVINNKVSDEEKIKQLAKVVDYNEYVIGKAIQKPISYLKKDEKAIKKAEAEISNRQSALKNINKTILSELEKI